MGTTFKFFNHFLLKMHEMKTGGSHASCMLHFQNHWIYVI